MGSFEQACEVLSQAIELYEKLLEEKPENLGYQAELAVALSRLGNCLVQQGPEKSDTAKQSLEKALTMQENIFNQQPEDATIKDAIALTRERLEKLETMKIQEKPENLEKLENSEKLEKQENLEEQETLENPENLEQEKPENPENLEEQEKPETLENLENPENSEKPEKL
jgi:hypothetical protein